MEPDTGNLKSLSVTIGQAPVTPAAAAWIGYRDSRNLDDSSEFTAFMAGRESMCDEMAIGRAEYLQLLRSRLLTPATEEGLPPPSYDPGTPNDDFRLDVR